MLVNQRQLPRGIMESLTLQNLRTSSTAYGKNLRHSIRGTTTFQEKGKSSRLKPQRNCRKYAGSTTLLKAAKGVVTLIENVQKGWWPMLFTCQPIMQSLIMRKNIDVDAERFIID